MKKVFLGLACVVGLAACADGRGQVMDPRYRFSSAAPYDQYRAAREMALTGQGAAPQVVPRAHPFAAPTPDMISSRTAVQTVTGQGAAAAATTTAPAAGKGGYYDPATGERLSSVPAAPRPVAPVTQQSDALTRYALSQRQAPGTAAYTRAGGSAAEAAKACARYPNADTAQLTFLSAGGPQQDPLGMDPDGDGFVCGWDPAPHRVSQL